MVFNPTPFHSMRTSVTVTLEFLDLVRDEAALSMKQSFAKTRWNVYVNSWGS